MWLRSMVGLCLVSGLLGSSAEAQTGVVSSAEQEVRRLFEVWRQASERADVRAIDSLLADDYRITRPDGSVTLKQQTMAGVRRDSAAIAALPAERGGRLREIAYTDMVVRLYGDFAVVTYHSRYRSPEGDDGDFEVMRILQHRNGRWRIVGGHSVRLPTCRCP